MQCRKNYGLLLTYKYSFQALFHINYAFFLLLADSLLMPNGDILLTEVLLYQF